MPTGTMVVVAFAFGYSMPSLKIFPALLFAAAQFSFPAAAQSSFPPTPPVKLAVNPVTNKVYMANGDANTVTAFDASTGASVTIPVGAGASYIAVNPVTNRVYVNNGRDASLSVIDGATDTVTGTYPIGSTGPIAINPVTNVIYVVRLTGTGSDEVTFFNGATSTWYTIATQSFQPGAMAVNPATGKIYISHYATGDVRVIDGAFNPADDFPAAVSIGAWSHPFAIAANPVTNKVYVITEDSRGPIGIIDGANNTAVFPAAAAGHASQPKAIAVDPVTNKVYAAFANEVVVIDGVTNAFSYIPIGGAATGGIALGINYATNRIFAASAGGTLTVIDGDSGTVSETQSIPAGTSSVGVNPLTGTAYFFDTTLHAVTGFSGDTPHPIPLVTTITPFTSDTTGPSGTVTMTATSTFAPTALSVRRVYFQIDSRAGAWTAASGNDPFSAAFTGLSSGAHTIYAFAADGQDAPLATGPQSNPLTGQVASYRFTVTGAKATPSVSLASSLNPSASAQQVTFTASVSGSSGAASGSVTFMDGTNAICPSVAVAGGVSSCSTSALAAGSHPITARYSGDATYDTATSGAVNQVVNAPRVTPSVSVTSSANPSVVGQSVTFTASVSGGSGVPSGSIDFSDGATSLAGCSAVVLASGAATCSTATLASGSHSVTASYTGDASHNAATSSALTQAVSAPRADLAISQAVDRDPVTAGTETTFTLTVVNAGPSAASSVTVTDTLPAGAALVSAPSACTNSSGTLTCGVGPLAAGQSFQLAVVVRPSSAGSMTNQAGVSASQSDPSSPDNSSTLTVTVKAAAAPAAGPLSNISTRGQVLTGNDVMIGGFVIGGSASKTVVVRAIGPSLAAFGVAGAVSNPTLQLVRASDQSIIASNDNWQDASNAAQLQASGFAPSDPLESAILVNLQPGAYTAIVSGVGGATGVGLVEVYEVDHPEVPLVNISTRGKVLDGPDVMIGGFVIQGSSAQTVVIRAIGPSLANFGVNGVLSNPTMRLVRMSDQATIATNDDWGSAANAAQVQSSGFAPSNALESAVLVTLQPGAYTAIVSGVNGATGVGLVEVYTVAP